MRPTIIFCAVATLCSSGHAQASIAPAAPPCLRFECYPARAVAPVGIAKPKFKVDDDIPHFHEAVLLALKKGPNFAGAYALVETSCGTGCAGIAVIDDRTGETFRDTTPVGEVHFGTPLQPYGKISYRLNSRLLVVEGRIEAVAKTPIRAYYEWCDPGFRLLRIVPLGAGVKTGGPG